MTIEEKARAYDEALERAKEQIKECGDNEGRKKMIRNIFSELRESEKPLTPFQQCLNLILHEVYYASVPGSIIEDVDKFILGIVKNRTDELVELAKRYECTDCQLRESEDERTRKELLDYVKYNKEHTPETVPGEHWDRWISYLEKQKERGPLTKEEEYILHRIIEYLEDETCPTEWISLLHDIYCLSYEKQKEQKPAEWSEEDEKMIDAMIDIVSGSFYEPLCPRKEMLAWLKSLRPCPSWKPSEEQMNCLCAAVDAAIRKHNESVSGYEPARVLKSLYEDLQKL